MFFFKKKQKDKNVYSLPKRPFGNSVDRREKICEICLGELNRRLVIDHNHKTGKVRGILCEICNVFLDAKYIGNIELKAWNIRYEKRISKYKKRDELRFIYTNPMTLNDTERKNQFFSVPNRPLSKYKVKRINYKRLEEFMLKTLNKYKI